MQAVRSVASGGKFYRLPPDKENTGSLWEFSTEAWIAGVPMETLRQVWGLEREAQDTRADSSLIPNASLLGFRSLKLVWVPPWTPAMQGYDQGE